MILYYKLFGFKRRCFKREAIIFRQFCLLLFILAGAPEPRGQLPLLPFGNGGAGAALPFLVRLNIIFITGNNLCDV